MNLVLLVRHTGLTSDLIGTVPSEMHKEDVHLWLFSPLVKSARSRPLSLLVGGLHACFILKP
jgi:hypothetical protein